MSLRCTEVGIYQPGEEVAWTDLVSVDVLLTGTGPFTEDVYFVLEGTAGGLTARSSEAEVNFLLDRLLALPDFQHLPFIAAMGHAEAGRVRVWERTAAVTSVEVAAAVADRAILPLPIRPLPGAMERLCGLRQRHAGRPYHGWSHIRACLDEWQVLREEWVHPDEVWAAILYHDLVYVPGAGDNERRSAGLAVAELGGLGLDLDYVRSLIGLTARHGQLGLDEDAADEDTRRFLDIDMSILGQPPWRYDSYSRAVRAEYARLPGPAYNFGRARFLKAVLAQPRIFLSERYHQRYDAPARENLVRELAGLGWPGWFAALT